MIKLKKLNYFSLVVQFISLRSTYFLLGQESFFVYWWMLWCFPKFSLYSIYALRCWLMDRKMRELVSNLIKSVMCAYQEDWIPTLFHQMNLLLLWGNFFSVDDWLLHMYASISTLQYSFIIIMRPWIYLYSSCWGYAVSSYSQLLRASFCLQLLLNFFF